MAISQQNFWGCTLSAHPQSYQHEKPPVNLLFYDGVWNIETVILMGHQILIRQFCGVWNFVHKIKNILHPGVALTLWPLPYITIIWLITEHFQYDFNFRGDCSVSLFLPAGPGMSACMRYTLLEYFKISTVYWTTVLT
jgi:hypothetical protein